MRRIRLTARYNPQDPDDDVAQLVHFRRSLWKYRSIYFDSENPFCEMKRDRDRNPYITIAIESSADLEKLLTETGLQGRFSIADEGEVGTICARLRVLRRIRHEVPELRAARDYPVSPLRA